MRVGVYIDGFNLYYGGRGICGGKGVAGWKWLDVRVLATALIGERADWTGAIVERVVYCTAPVSGADHPSGAEDQRRYIQALKQSRTADVVELGHYVNRVKFAPLAVADAKGRPVLTNPQWPVMVQDAAGAPVPGASRRRSPLVATAHRSRLHAPSASRPLRATTETAWLVVDRRKRKDPAPLGAG